MSVEDFTLRRAESLLEKGVDYAEVGDYLSAREMFKESAEIFHSAESFTYWGWMEHQLGNTLLAINLCRKAIRVDPDYGNPYNDIGSYYMSLGRMDDAIPWLEKAIDSERYEPRHFPHINLGRIYLMKSLPLRALKEFEEANRLAPDPEITKMIDAIRGHLN